MTEGPVLVVVRHGETEWSREGRHTGRADIGLTPAGEAQARRLAAPLSAWSFETVLCSPLRRAVRTCELAGYGDRAELLDDAREWDYGDYEGRTVADIAAENPGWSLWLQGTPGGETLESVAARAERVIARVRETPGDALLFAHGHLLRVLAARWCDLAPVAGRNLHLSPASISLLGDDRGIAPIIWRWNDEHHLHEG